MEVDDDSDIYSPEPGGSPAAEPAVTQSVAEASEAAAPAADEDDEEEEEDSDSDIDIITERKDGTTPAPPPSSRYNNIRDIPQRNPSKDAPTLKATPAVKKEPASRDTSAKPSGELPAIATSKIDVNAKPIYEPAGKPITEVNIDEDLPDNDKPWRRPGTDITDYFNYGFDEFTWALYAGKQESIRQEFDPEKIAESQKKMMEEMNMMMMGNMPGMPGAAGAMAMPGMPSADGMPPEMQAMMQQLMAGGMDPSQMDPAMFAAMTGGQGGATGQAAGAGGNQGQGFQAQQGFGQAQNGGFGFDQGMNQNRNNFRGRGRGRNW